jgi:hypothetical protein
LFIRIIREKNAEDWGGKDVEGYSFEILVSYFKLLFK